MSVYYLHAVFITTSMGYKFIIKVSYKNRLVLRKIYYCDLGQNFSTCPAAGQVETRSEHTCKGGKAKYFGRFLHSTDPNILFSVSTMQKNKDWLVSVGFCCTFAKLSKPQKRTDSTI